VSADTAGWPVVSCGSDALLLREVQPAGAMPMTGKAFAAGRPDFVGSRLTPNAQDGRVPEERRVNEPFATPRE
jgi:hypothetical protein